jgi:pimeloyl-ACP methyl ester carboxylesterase
MISLISRISQNTVGKSVVVFIITHENTNFLSNALFLFLPNNTLLCAVFHPFPSLTYMKKSLKWTGIVVAVLGIGFVAGPRPDAALLSPTLPVVSQALPQLEKDIADSEAKFNLKPDNQARIVWADSTQKQKTPYSIVYIHGFGASWAEGDPIHQQLAQKYKANLYLARMYDAGVKDRDAFKTLTPENFLENAKHALAVGKALGEKVIVIGCSAGGLLTTYLASEHPDIAAIVLYSPCYGVNAMGLATGPWGEQLLGGIMGTHRDITHYTPERANYWLTRFHTNGLLTLQKTIDAVFTPTVFEKIKMPVLMVYYYKDEENQDKVVSVEAIKKGFEMLGTPEAQKRQVALPEAGDHVIASHCTSKDLKGVFEASDKFLSEVVIKP